MRMGGSRPALLALVIALIWVGIPVAREVTGAPLPTRRGGTIQTQMEWPVSLNPLVHANHDLSSLLHAGLVEVNANTRRIEPAVAASMESSRDGRVLTFTLRPGVRFSDGTLLTAEDVAFTFNELVLNPRNDLEPRTWMDAGRGRYVLDRVEVAGANVVRFHLNVPLPLAFTSWLTAIPILPKHKLAGIDPRDHRRMWRMAEPPANIVGLGPFSLREIERDRITLTRNLFYWKRDEAGTQLPYADEVILHRAPRFTLEGSRLRVHPALDLLEWPGNFGPAIVQAWSEFARSERYRLRIGGPVASTVVFALNQDVGPAAARGLFRDVRFRRALAHAVNRDRLVGVFPFGGRAKWSTVNFHSPAYQEDRLPQYTFDPLKAREVLTSIGIVDRDGDGAVDFPDGTTVQFSLLVDSGNTIERTIADLLREDFANVGIRVTVIRLPYEEMHRRVFESPKPTFDAVVLSFRDAQLYPALHLSVVFFHLDEPTHIYRRSDGAVPPSELPEAQRVLLALAGSYRLESNPERWLAIQIEMQRVAGEDLSVMPLVAGNYVYLVKDGLENTLGIEGWSTSLFARIASMWWSSNR